MENIEWIAIYAAIVSTGAFLWNIIKYFCNQANIKLSAEVSSIYQFKKSKIDVIFPLDPNKSYLVIRITNVGGKIVVVDEMGIQESNGTRDRPSFSTPPKFPKTLKPGDFENYYIGKFDKLLSSTEKKIYVKSTKGKEWLFDISKLDVLHYNK